ncbi:MAG: ABC transporter ATP-binding protein [Acidilobaceae archaeon]
MTIALECSNIKSYYGKIQVLRGVSLRLPEGSIVAVLGPNGAGKTTLLKTIMGITIPIEGSIKLYDRDVSKLPPHVKVDLGLTMVPEGRRLFPDLTVLENLQMGAYTRRAREKMRDSLEIVFNLFPVLKERLNQKAGTLSGGEQQMLAIARALMSKPKIILLDEPSQGLAPKVAWSVAETLESIMRELGVSILLVEQNIAIALDRAEYVYVMEQGRIVTEGSKDEIVSKKIDVVKAYLGI